MGKSKTEGISTPSTSRWFREFGIALDAEVLKISAYAVVVGLIAGLVAMAAVFAGIARAPFTSIVFLFELSRNPNALLPLVVCCMVSDGCARLFSAESIMTGKLVKRGLIVRQDYSVPVLMRARIEEGMRKNFTPVPADAEVRAVVQEVVAPENTGVLPVVEKDGKLMGIIEAHDLLRGLEKPAKVRDVAHQNYVVAHLGETVDKVTRTMLLRQAENVVVVEDGNHSKPIGVARAADILRLRRWTIEEESQELAGAKQ